jgi:hypothetical protein
MLMAEGSTAGILSQPRREGNNAAGPAKPPPYKTLHREGESRGFRLISVDYSRRARTRGLSRHDQKVTEICASPGHAITAEYVRPKPPRKPMLTDRL